MTGVTEGKRIHPVLLSGGAGVRLWPMSRALYPKQLLPLVSERTMIQDTAARVADRERFAAPIVVCNEEHRFIIAEQLRDGAPDRAIILEPVGRNTAPAVAIAALAALERDADALILVLPADHLIRDEALFRHALDQAVAAAEAGYLVTFGIEPTSPETGYGYIRRGDGIGDLTDVFRVAEFVEKPERAVAETYLKGGAHFWNSGMFLFPAGLYLAELERYAPDVLDAARQAHAGGQRDLDFYRLDAEAFARSPDISVDYAVMERTETAVVVPAAIGWTDVGSWAALWDVGDKNADGNVMVGDVLVDQCRNSYIRSEDALTTVLGLDDVVVVVTEDAVLVAAKDRVQDIKSLVDRLKQSERSEPMAHKRIHRPWGYAQSLHAGERFQVKRLTLAPGAKLSLQMHYHRAEHWVVVNGTALVTRGEEQLLLRENESVYIPLGTLHRLENPGKVPLNIIEVQSGAYLAEDDIVRLDDSYGRS